MGKDDHSTVTLTVLRTSDAQRTEINVSMSMTLNDLVQKELLFLTNHDPKLRIFHMGRELKNGGRTLEQLGLGRFHNFILHVHGCNDKKATSARRCKRSRQRKVKTAPASLPGATPSSVIDLLDSDDDNDVVECVGTGSSIAANKRGRVTY